MLAIAAVQPLKQYMVTNIPIMQRFDPVLCVCLWLLLSGLINLPTFLQRKKGIIRFPDNIFFLQGTLAFLVMASLLWTPAPIYGSYKGLRFATVNSALLVLPIILVQDTASLRRLTLGFAILALVVYGKIALWPSYAVAMFSEDKIFRAGFLYGNDAAPFALVFGSTFLISQCVSTKHIRIRMLCLIAVLMVMLGAWNTGTRASVGSMLVASIMTIMLAANKNRIRLALGMLTVLLLSTGIAYFMSPEIQRLRIISGITEIDASGDARIEHWGDSIDAMLKKPLGGGVGSYSTTTTGYDMRWFPHNIFLEVGVELGIQGLVLLLSLFMLFVKDFIWFRAELLDGSAVRNMAEMWFVGTLCALCIAFITDDIADNRAIWLGMGMTIVSLRLALSRQIGANCCGGWRAPSTNAPKRQKKGVYDK